MVPSQTGASLVEIEVDTRRNTFWMFDQHFQAQELRRESMDGETLLVIKDDQVHGRFGPTAMVLDPSTGGVWIVTDYFLSKVSIDGETVFSLDIPH